MRVRHHVLTTTDGKILMPGEQRQRVLMRPLVAGIAIGAGISAAVLVWLAVADDLDANDPSAWAILIVPALILLTLGALQSLWWRHKLGGIRYEADVATLRVVRHGAVIHEWRWNDIRNLRLDGGVDWYTLVVLKAGADDFPRLVIESSEGVTRAPGVLIWGRDKAQSSQRRLNEMRRAHSH